MLRIDRARAIDIWLWIVLHVLQCALVWRSKIKVTSSHRLYVSSLPLLNSANKCYTCVIRGGRGIPCRPNPAATFLVQRVLLYVVGSSNEIAFSPACLSISVCNVKVWTHSRAACRVRLATNSALQSQKWQLIGMSQWCRSALGPMWLSISCANGQLDPLCS